MQCTAWSWGTVAPTCSLACTRTSELMSSTGWQVCALRIVARVPRPAALVCHALRRGARHHVGYAALRCFAGYAGSTRFRSEPGVIRPSGVQIRCVPDSYADSRGCTSIIFDPPNHLLCTNRCQASELSAHTFYYRGVDFRRSQQALGAAARRAHRRGQRGVQAGEAAGEARCVRLSIPGTTRRSCPRRPMRCLPQSPVQPEVRVPMLLVAE